ncbi:CAP10 domain-containing protein, partial [Haematococcus lacustris]
APCCRYKYLISADGFTASCRFGKLLGVNSVIVKEDSPWVEYYYRALSPGQHYLTFTKDSAWQALYMRRVLLEYVQLFPVGAMTQFVTALDNSTLASRQLMQAKLAATKP